MCPANLKSLLCSRSCKSHSTQSQEALTAVRSLVAYSSRLDSKRASAAEADCLPAWGRLRVLVGHHRRGRLVPGAAGVGHPLGPQETHLLGP